MAAAPAPKFALVEVVNAILDTLIKGLGADAAVAAAVSLQPWLALPVISWILSYFVRMLEGALDENLKKSVDIVLIRFGNDLRQADYEKKLEPIRSGKATPDEIQAAKDAIDRLVRRGN